jgi:hypothetical protein
MSIIARWFTVSSAVEMVHGGWFFSRATQSNMPWPKIMVAITSNMSSGHCFRSLPTTSIAKAASSSAGKHWCTVEKLKSSARTRRSWAKWCTGYALQKRPWIHCSREQENKVSANRETTMSKEKAFGEELSLSWSVSESQGSISMHSLSDSSPDVRHVSGDWRRCNMVLVAM